MDRRRANGYAALAAVLLAMPLTAVAAGGTANWQDWQAMHQQVVGAQEVLRGDISNGLNRFGGILDMVLTPDHSKVQYILFKAWYPYSIMGLQSGFVSYQNATVWNGAGLDSEVTVNDMDAAKAPAELKLTNIEGTNRLVSRLIGEQLYFPGGDSREVKNLLIDRKSGDVAAYVVDMDKNSLFETKLRAIPADDVTVANARVTTNVKMEDVDEMQKFNPDYL